MNWAGRRVLLTGHTGFKGGWLALWLQSRGAELCGLALEPPTRENLFTAAEVGAGMRSELGDIRDAERVGRLVREFRPEVIFHLAAQPLVRASYVDPVDTYATNLLGTVHVLEAVRRSEGVRAVVAVTTDKCYENSERERPYCEEDRLGGYDPYSSSKACAELAVAAYRSSFFAPEEYARHGVAIATVRAGNVIGGGDWAEDRLAPDALRAFAEGRPVRIRNPHAVRPWQHVLEPLRGYLQVAEKLLEEGPAWGEAWNFGPEPEEAWTVERILRELAALWGEGAAWELDERPQPHEAQRLTLDWSKAARRLGWRPQMRLPEALAATVQWSRTQRSGQRMRAFTLEQIARYEASWKDVRS